MAGYVITSDDDGTTFFFIGAQMGFWESATDLDRARIFGSRAAAATFMQKAHRHREGWRVENVSRYRRARLSQDQRDMLDYLKRRERA